jgi:hypothetical protein
MSFPMSLAIKPKMLAVKISIFLEIDPQEPTANLKWQPMRGSTVGGNASRLQLLLFYPKQSLFYQG